MSVTEQPKSRDRDWIVIALLLISEASSLRRWQVKTLTFIFPQACQGQVSLGEAWEGNVDKEHKAGPGDVQAGNPSLWGRGLVLVNVFIYWSLDQDGQHFDQWSGAPLCLFPVFLRHGGSVSAFLVTRHVRSGLG